MISGPIFNNYFQNFTLNALIITTAEDLFCNNLLHLSIIRGSYMSAHVLLNLLNELGKIDKMRGLLSILPLFFSQKV